MKNQIYHNQHTDITFFFSHFPWMKMVMDLHQQQARETVRKVPDMNPGAQHWDVQWSSVHWSRMFGSVPNFTSLVQCTTLPTVWFCSGRLEQHLLFIITSHSGILKRDKKPPNTLCLQHSFLFQIKSPLVPFKKKTLLWNICDSLLCATCNAAIVQVFHNCVRLESGWVTCDT